MSLGANQTLALNGLSATANVTLAANVLTIGSANNLSSSFAGVISGTGSVAVAGTGTATLIGNNTYTGNTSIGATSQLQIGSGNTTGTLGTGLSQIVEALVFNRSNTMTVASVISGNGTLTQAGNGTVTLTANNTYTGNTTISAGTLQAGNGNATGTLGTGATDYAALIFDTTSNITVASAISGNGTLSQAGNGTVNLTGNNTAFAGNTTISNGGTVNLNSCALGTQANVTLSDSAVVSLGANQTLGSLNGLMLQPTLLSAPMS